MPSAPVRVAKWRPGLQRPGCCGHWCPRRGSTAAGIASLHVETSGGTDWDVPAGLLVAGGAHGTCPLPSPSLCNCLNDNFFQCLCSLPHAGAHSGLRAVARGRLLQSPEAGLAGGPGHTSRPDYLTLWAKGHRPHRLKAEGAPGHHLPWTSGPGRGGELSCTQPWRRAAGLRLQQREVTVLSQAQPAGRWLRGP